MAVKASNQVSIFDITDAYSVILTSEAYTFVGNTTGAPSGLTCTTQAVAYCGTQRCSKVSIGTITCPTGISASIANNNTTSPTITFKTTATVTNACEATIPIVVDGITINKKFSFAVAKTGATGTKGETGSQGYSLVAYVSRESFTEANWSTYGTIGHEEGWSGTENIRNGCRVGDLFAVVGTATDTKNSHMLIYRSDNGSGRLHGSCISHIITPRGATGATGATGKGVKSSAVTYQASTSGTAVPTGTWSTSIPSVSAGSYLWTKTVITYTDNATTTSYSVGKMGSTGSTGATGKGVKSTAVTYQAGSSGTTAPTGTWLTSVPKTSASAPYLWTKMVITYTDNTTSTSYSVGSTPEGITVGGRNLYVGGSKWRKDTPATTGTVDDAYLYLSGATAYLEKNKVYTLQAVCDLPWSTAHGSGAGAGKGTIWIASEDRKYHRVFVGDGVTTGRYTWTFTHVGDTGTYNVRVNGYTKATKFWDIKIESGNKATDWTPAPEDVQSDVNEAANTAKYFMDMDEDNGLQVGNKKSGSWSGFRTQITSSAFNILNTAGSVVASYGSKLIELGKNATDAVIKLCGGKGEIKYDGSAGHLNFSSDYIKILGTRGSSIASNYEDKANLRMYDNQLYFNTDGLEIYTKRFEGYSEGSGWTNPTDSYLRFTPDHMIVETPTIQFKGNLTGLYLTGTWLQSTAASNLGYNSGKIAVLDGSGWVYYRTPAQICEDIGIAAMSVSCSTALTLSTSLQKVVCNNNMSAYSQSLLTAYNGGIKCNVAGHVLVFGNVYIEGLTAGNNVNATIYKNSTNYGSARTGTSKPQVTAHAPVRLINVSAGEVIYLYSMNHSAATGTVQANQNTMLTVLYVHRG